MTKRDQGPPSSRVTTPDEFLAAVEDGKRAAREGRVVAHDAVTAAFARIVGNGEKNGTA